MQHTNKPDLDKLRQIIKENYFSDRPVSHIIVLEFKEKEYEQLWNDIHTRMQTTVSVHGKPIQIQYQPVRPYSNVFYTTEGWHEHVKWVVMKQHLDPFKEHVSFLLCQPLEFYKV